MNVTMNSLQLSIFLLFKLSNDIIRILSYIYIILFDGTYKIH